MREYVGMRKKRNTIRTNETTRRDKTEGTGERKKTKKIPRQDQTIQTTQDIPNQRKKIVPASRRRRCEDIPTTECKKSKTILAQNMGMKISQKS